VLHAGIAENICVQGKCEGIPTLTKLGFNCVLMRDLTDAQSHYDPQSYRPGGKPWAHMDWGTRNVTRAIEDQGIAVTVEGASLARAAGLWPAINPDPVLHAPWGTVQRPQIFDGSQTVTLSTWCDVEASVGCDGPYSIHYTIDGTDPAISRTAAIYVRPFVVAESCVVRAVGLGSSVSSAQNSSGGASVVVRFAESQSVLVRRPLPPMLDSKAAIPLMLKNVSLPIENAPILWDFGDDQDYRQFPVVNASWIGRPLTFREQTFPTGLGLKAPMHLNFNLTAIRLSTHSPLRKLFLAAAIDGGCDVGGASGGQRLAGFNRVYNCHDIAEFQHARMKVYLDGQLVEESPTLQSQGLEWIFQVDLPRQASILRIVVVPAEKQAGVYSASLAVQQDAYGAGSSSLLLLPALPLFSSLALHPSPAY
jgi:hypothetical protein